MEDFVMLHICYWPSIDYLAAIMPQQQVALKCIRPLQCLGDRSIYEAILCLHALVTFLSRIPQSTSSGCGELANLCLAAHIAVLKRQEIIRTILKIYVPLCVQGFSTLHFILSFG